MGAEQLVATISMPMRPVMFLLAVSYYLTGKKKIEEMLSCGFSVRFHFLFDSLKRERE